MSTETGSEQVAGSVRQNYAAVLNQLKTKFAGSTSMEEDQSTQNGSGIGEGMVEPIPYMDNAANDDQQMPITKFEGPVRLIVPTIKPIKRIPLEHWQIRAYYGIGDPDSSSSPLPSSSSYDDDDEEDGDGESADGNFDEQKMMLSSNLISFSQGLPITTSSLETKDEEETFWNNVKQEEEESMEENVRELLAMTAIEDKNGNLISPTPNIGKSDDEHGDHHTTNLANLRSSVGRTPKRPNRLIIDPRKKRYEEAPI